MDQQGYYREPTVWGDTVVFVCEDDLWTTSLSGGISRRLTTGLGAATCPHFSPDGRWIAFTGTEEGCEEVYLMPANGGLVRRLTFLDESALVIGWDREGHILFSSPHASPFMKFRHLYRLSPEGSSPEELPVGPCNFIAYGPEKGQIVLQRHGYGYISWKRYRGGTAGELWIDAVGSGDFHKLLSLTSNTLRPLWIGERIYFLSDHEGRGSLYSCTPQGDDLQCHVRHGDYYLRAISTDGKRIVYSFGGSLGLYDIASNTGITLAFQHTSATPQKARYFASPSKNLTSYTLSPHGHHLAITTRGRLFRMTPHRGPVLQQGEQDGVRYRLACWLHQGDHLLVVKDEGKEEILEIYEEDALKPPARIAGLDWGRILSLKASPCGDAILLTNHRNELIHVDLTEKKCRVLDKSLFGPLQGFNWSPDGRWAAYSVKTTSKISILRLVNILTGDKTDLTRPVLSDFSPSFDPEGKYLYFLSTRTFQPAWDQLTFDLNFPKGTKPYLIALQKATPSPFLPPLPQDDEPHKDDKEKDEEKAEEKKIIELEIDLEGIQDRILEFPVPEGIYTKIAGLKGKVMTHSVPLSPKEGDEEEDEDGHDTPCEDHGKLQVYDFSTLKQETILLGVGGFSLSLDTHWMVSHSGKRLRMLKAGEKPEEHDTSYKAGGWLDWERVRLSVNPSREWRHMFDEAWRLQQELFWTADMSKVDWDAVYRRYLPLVDRLATPDELIDLIGEMQGELGSSHAYVWPAEEPVGPSYKIGQLGATLVFDPQQEAYRITHIDRGDPWNPQASSPLLRPGFNIREGDLIWAVAGQRVSQKISPQQLLVNQTRNLIPLTVSDPQNQERRTLLVAPLANLVPVRYRDWVEKNRRYVHEKTGGRVGYIHIPNMATEGFAEFHRAYLLEHHREGLVIDARFNGGGLVSGLLLEKLARKRIGFDQSRWDGTVPYPLESPAGPMVALSNEYTGSDGDIFCHSFKTFQLGPVIGKRTWGGVIGIFPRNPLLDGSTTTQPEYSFWFHDVGWSVENYGVDPDIEVDITPQDYRVGVDPQLDRGIQEVLALVEIHTPLAEAQEKKASMTRPDLGGSFGHL